MQIIKENYYYYYKRKPGTRSNNTPAPQENETKLSYRTLVRQTNYTGSLQPSQNRRTFAGQPVVFRYRSKVEFKFAEFKGNAYKKCTEQYRGGKYVAAPTYPWEV